MGLKPKYIKDKGYEVEDDFIDSISELEDITLKILISDYIDSNVKDYPINKLTTYVVGGFVIHRGNPVYFAIEILRLPRKFLKLTDFHLIEVDEYLDLINLKSYIK
jgi:hypothetical protein|tara:strand:+ start:96 stop:413 length:318 start_codon:yes stop_codon:yes gene_type:complete